MNFRMHFFCVEKRDFRCLPMLKEQTKFISDTFSDEDSDLEDLSGVPKSVFDLLSVDQ